MQGPLIHFNGTSREGLLEQWENAYRALGEAYDVVKQSAPHMRDYYPLPDSDKAFAQAVAEHRSRLQRIEDIRKEFSDLAIAVHTK